MNALIRWWMIFCTIVTGFVFLWMTGLVNFAWNADHSKLGFVALALFTIVTPFVGYLTYKLRNVAKMFNDTRRQYLRYIQACWFAADSLMAIGMAGTLTGFIMMFTDAMNTLTGSTDTEAIKAIIVSLSHGFTTGVVTTLIGVITCVLLKLQLVSLEVSLDTVDE